MNPAERGKNDEPKRVDSLTSELPEYREGEFFSSVSKTVIAFAAVAGFAGGVVGALFFVPWYQNAVLGERDGDEPRNKQIILDEESAVIQAVEKVNPAVVSIVISKDLPKYEQFGSPFGGFFFSVPSGETEKQQVGAGSGFVISSDGMIVTNKHVVSDPAAEYTVVTRDSKKFPAKVVATDPFNDLAIVKIEGSSLPRAELGSSDDLKLGQRVIAIGNALGEFQNSVTTGVVSGIGRTITASGAAQTEKLSEVIQTDAAINPGNSGGPLINLVGEVIGVNTATSLQGQLIGFAIPVDQVKKVVNDVEKFGKVQRPFLGVRYMIVTDTVASFNNLPVTHGAWVVKGSATSEPAVIPGSPAERTGIAEGDVILEFNNEKITVDNQLADILRNYNPGDRVILKIHSGGKERTVSVNLGEAQ